MSQMREWSAHGVTLLLPGECARQAPLVLLIGAEPEQMEELRMFLPAPSKLTLIGVPVADWDRELSPWPAAAVFPGRQPFAGRGPELLEKLLAALPEAERSMELSPCWRGIAGYSLAGLFALWAACGGEVFSAAASMSGSLWYDGAADFFGGCRTVPRRVYFSLGDREPLTKNARLAGVLEGTKQTCEAMRAAGAECVFESVPGNHFADVTARILRGLLWLAG